jgi:hypothetical protein
MAGRPSKYESHVQPKLLLIEAWSRDGLTHEQIANNLDVGVSTFSEYKNLYPELTEALKNGREVIDVMVENALLKAALGYEYRDEELNKATGEPIEIRKTAHPNTTALIFWLKNRKPKEWRDKQEIGLEGELNIKVSLPKGLGSDADD